MPEDYNQTPILWQDGHIAVGLATTSGAMKDIYECDYDWRRSLADSRQTEDRERG